MNTPLVDALMAKWDDDGATRGSAFVELRDLARSLEEDARRYRFLKENIQEDYLLPGSFYLADCATECWDRTIDASQEETK